MIAITMLCILLITVALADSHINENKQHMPSEILYQNGRTKRGVIDNSIDSIQDECVSPEGSVGRCRPLHYCLQQYDFYKLMNHLCIIDKKIGACCPEDLNGIASEGLAGTLPATAQKDETNELLLRTNRAENRGCGVSTRSSKQESNSTAHEWPWIASIMLEDEEHHCGGALITDRHIITAAHCTRKYKPEELFVRLGEYDWQLANETRTYNFKVMEKREHELYDWITNRHDISLLKLDKRVLFNSYVWPICLPPSGLMLTNKTAYVIGWGSIRFGYSRSHVLKEVAVPIWEHEACVKSFVEPVFQETLCAGDGDRDACQGDSGGPLMYQMPSGRWTLIGVVSWGVGCGEPSHPGLYARIDKYLRWIRNNIH